MELITYKTFFLHKAIPHLHLSRSTKGIYIRTETEQPQVHLNFRCKLRYRKGPMLCQNKCNYICKCDNRTSDPIWHATTYKHSNSFISHVIQLNIFATLVYSLDSKMDSILQKEEATKSAFTQETLWELIHYILQQEEALNVHSHKKHFGRSFHACIMGFFRRRIYELSRTFGIQKLF